MKLFIVEVQEIYSRSAPSEYVCTIEHLFALTNILDKASTVKAYKIGSGGVYFPSHPAGSQCDKLVTVFNWD